MMEDISPVALGLNNPLCGTSAISSSMEITRLKLETETASLLSEPAMILNKMVKDKGKPDVLVQEVQESEEDETLSVMEDASLLTSIDLLPLDVASSLSVPLDASLEMSLPIAVEIEGTENGQILAKVISLDDRSIKTGSSENIATAAEKQNEECSNGPTLKASVVAVKLSGEKNSAKGGVKSVFELDCLPLWGSVSICGHRPEMEDAVIAVPNFMKIPINMFMGDDGISNSLSHLTSHIFGVYDGHGGSQVANFCRDRIHFALEDELLNTQDVLTRDHWQVQWEKVFTSCFAKVDEQVSGKTSRAEENDADGSSSSPIAPETVGSTAVVAVVCSSHIIVANCGDSRAVLYRGKEAIALSVDHKPSREDEYARIEAAGGKVIQWNGLRVFGVLAMSRAIGNRYLKPWIIPKPEVMFVARARDDECLVIASDGIWDVMSNEEACESARKRILMWHKKNGLGPLAEDRGRVVDPAAQAAAEYLSSLALQKGSKDNISVIVVDLKARRKFKSKS